MKYFSKKSNRAEKKCRSSPQLIKLSSVPLKYSKRPLLRLGKLNRKPKNYVENFSENFIWKMFKNSSVSRTLPEKNLKWSSMSQGASFLLKIEKGFRILKNQKKSRRMPEKTQTRGPYAV